METYIPDYEYLYQDDLPLMDNIQPSSQNLYSMYDNNNYESTDKSQQYLSSTEDHYEQQLYQDYQDGNFQIVKPQYTEHLLKKRTHHYSKDNHEDQEDQQQHGFEFTDSYHENEGISNQETVSLRQATHSQFSDQFILRQQRYLPANKRFYLYLDLVVDLEFFQNYSDKQNFLKDKKHLQLEKGLRYIHQVSHRMDNKFIEVDMSFFPSTVGDMEYLIQILYSYGNKDLLQTINKFQTIWTNIQLTKQQIYNQLQDPIFKLHQENRKLASNMRFKKLTEGLNPGTMIFYIRLSVNYEKMLFESDRVGYSPELYELLAENSYAFKEYLSAYGYFDPRNTIYKLEQCINTTLYFLTNSLKPFFNNSGQNYQTVQAELKTIDRFIFPVEAKARFFNLNEDYDQQHNLNLKYNDILVYYEYTFNDPVIQEEFKNYRKQQQAVQSKPVTIYNDEEFDDRFDYKKTEFFKKYYDDQVDNLVAKGNKWYKKCGFVPIPQKKAKRCLLQN